MNAFCKYLLRFIVVLSFVYVINFLIVLSFSFCLADVKSESEISVKSDIKGSYRIFLVGASNIDYNYCDESLHEAFPDADIQRVSESLPNGLYYIVEKLLSFNPNENDIIVFDLPIHLLKEEYKMPLTEQTVRRLNYKTIDGLVKSGNIKLLLQYFIRPVQYYQSTIKIIRKRAKEKSRNSVRKLGNEEIHDGSYETCKRISENLFVRAPSIDFSYACSVISELRRIAPNVVIRLCPLIEGYYDIEEEVVESLSGGGFLDGKLIILPPDYAYDRPFHLNRCGAELNTYAIINLLLRNDISDYVKESQLGY